MVKWLSILSSGRVLAVAAACALAVAAMAPDAAKAMEPPTVTPTMRPYVSEDASLVALANVRVIDGTGAPARDNQTILLRSGRIERVGPADRVAIPGGAKVRNLAGYTVLPGLVHLHEHLWMFGGSLLSVPVSYPRLYLAAGVTSIRTAGSYNPYIDLKAKGNIEAGREVGPWMDLTIYLDLFGAPRLYDADATRRYVDFWLDAGFTSVKAYAYTNDVALKAAIDAAHARGVKVTGHLCGVTYAQAARLGIDDIEHGFAMSPDFIPNAPPVSRSPAEEAKGAECGAQALHGLERADPRGERARSLIRTLVENRVAITSTLPALEDLVPEIPPQPGLDVLLPQIRDHHERYRKDLRAGKPGMLVLSRDALQKSAIMERAFMKAGGLLVAGTDPAVPSAGVVAGYSSWRQLELMVEFGFTPLEAIRVSTLNGAVYLGRDKEIGSIAEGKQADLIVVRGDPSIRISDIRNVEIVFRQGIGYDPEKLRASVRGLVGLK